MIGWLFFCPFLTSALLLVIGPTLSRRNLKIGAFACSLIPLLILMAGHAQWIDSTLKYPWIKNLSIQFYLRIDSLSLLFLYLTAVIIPISIVAVSEDISFPQIFYSLILFLEGLLIGFFSAGDLVLFTIFYEAMLLPLYFIIAQWGKGKYAAVKFILYMIAGSTLMIASILSLYMASSSQGTGTFDIQNIAKIADHIPYANWIGAIFILAFAVKTPLFPFHAWLPDAYSLAPSSGSILLSSLLSKAGIYGFLRVVLEFFPTLLNNWNPYLLTLAILGVFYGGFAAWSQTDYKRLLAYSSFSHVNFILAGLFVTNSVAHSGAIFQSINHGITIAGLFLVAYWLEKRIRTTSLKQERGWAKYFPKLCWLTLVFVLANVALPGTNNFIGEILILFGIFHSHPISTVILTLTVILSVIYMLRWMQNVYFGPLNHSQEMKPDINNRELAIALSLIVLILWLGIYPSPTLKLSEKAANRGSLNEYSS